jgi:integrase
VKLTSLRIKNAKPGRHSDGKGLYLLVSPTGGKSWVLRVQVEKRRHDYGLGSLDLVSLSEAREKALKWRKVAKTGRNPSKEDTRLNAVVPTFEEAAKRYHQEAKGSWKNVKHADQWLSTLARYAFPKIGGLEVDRINAPEIQSVLIPIWQDKPETARRVRQRIGTVLENCHAMGWRQAPAPMEAVSTLLKAVRQPKRGRFAAMPYRAVPSFVAKLAANAATAGRLALQFLIMTAARSGEVRGARWTEINLEQATWTVPAVRMKMGDEHTVPLSTASIAILKMAKSIFPADDEALVFPGLRRQPLSDMTLSKALRDNGGSGFTVHGFRSAFRDWCAETGMNNDWAESALAHAVPNRVEAAYKRTKFLDQRRGLMQEWAEFCVLPAN